MSVITNMVRANPLPAFSSIEEVAKLSICGETWIIATRGGTPTADRSADFAVFKNLPNELKTKILFFAAEARTIQAVEVPIRQPSQPAATSSGQVTSAHGANTSGTFTFTGGRVPSILMVSKEVMELAGGMGYRLMFQTKGTNKALYFNPYIDTLDVQTTPTLPYLTPQLKLAEALVNPHELALVRNLCILESTFNVRPDNTINEDYAVVDIGSMPRLQVLTLVGTYDVFPTQPDFTLKLDYEKSKLTGGALVVANVSGIRYEGTNAHNLVQYWIPNTAAFGHITDVYTTINRVMAAHSVFPGMVKLEMRLRAEPMS